MNANQLHNTHTCSMPEHGRENAPSACCRPSSPHHAGPTTITAPASAKTLHFWGDRKVWRTASRNTLNCLIGCMIGDLATIVYMQAYHPEASMVLTMGLAMLAGLVTSVLFESSLLRYREGLNWGTAFKMALSMSFLSMLGMEFASNATDVMLTGGRVPFSDPFYWTALAISVGAGFLVPLPYNYWKFKQHGKACH